MTASKCLIPLAVAASLSAAPACSGGDDGATGNGGERDVEGAYTVTYQRVQSNSNCTTEDPDWIQGILVLEQQGSSLQFDFGLDYQVGGTLDGDTYTFEGDLTDGDGLVHVAGTGAFVDSAGELFIVGGDDDGIVADYVTDCRVRGTYSGARTTGSGG